MKWIVNGVAFENVWAAYLFAKRLSMTESAHIRKAN